MPCWSCHLCNEWNQPTNESCIECCHYRCGTCKVHYAMSHSINDEFTSHISADNASWLRSDFSSEDKTVCSSSSSNIDEHQVTRFFPSAPQSSNLSGFVTNLKTQFHSQIKTSPKELRKRKKAAAAWKEVVETNLPRKR